MGDVAEDVAEQVLGVHADEDGVGDVLLADAATDEGDVGHGVDGRAVGDELEITAVGLDGGLGDALDERFASEAVGDDVGDGAHFEIVFGAEAIEIGLTGHGAVVVHDFDDDGGGLETGEATEVDAALGLAGADEDAAIAGAEWADVAGAHQVVGLGMGIGEDANGGGAVGGGDAGGGAEAAVGIDGDGEGGAEGCGVDGGLWGEVEAIAGFTFEGDAEDAAGEAHHEVDGFGGDVLGGADEVAFVFAAFVVDEDDHPAVAERVEDVWDRAEQGIHRELGRLGLTNVPRGRGGEGGSL